MDEIYLPVEKVPVEDITIPGLEHPSGLSHAIVVTKPDGVRRVVQYCSEIYYLVENSSIIPVFEKEISRFYQVEKKIRIDRWSRFFIDFILKDKLVSIQDKDPVFPRIRLINSYDGSIKYHFQMGFWRLICSNGLMVPAGTIKEFKSMHTPKIGKETSFEEVLAMTSEFLAESNEAAEIYYELQDQPADDWMMRIEEVVEETAFPVSLQENVTERMGHELDLIPGAQPTDWLVYNAFNYQLNHNEDLKAKQSKKDGMDQEVLAYLLKY